MNTLNVQKRRKEKMKKTILVVLFFVTSVCFMAPMCPEKNNPIVIEWGPDDD